MRDAIALGLVTPEQLQQAADAKWAHDHPYLAGITSLFSNGGDRVTSSDVSNGNNNNPTPPDPKSPAGYVLALIAAVSTGSPVPDPKNHVKTPPLGVPASTPPLPSNPLQISPALPLQIDNLDDGTPVYQDEFFNRYIVERGTGRKVLLTDASIISNPLVSNYITNSYNAQQDVIATGGKTCVYSCVVNGQTVYVGISDDVLRRGAEQLRAKNIVIEQISGLQNLSRTDAHAVEQVLIEFHGLGKDGGTLLNKINSISSTRNKTTYEKALIRGAEILKSIRYPGF